MNSLEDEVGLPKGALLLPVSDDHQPNVETTVARFVTSSGISVSISSETCIRNDVDGNKFILVGRQASTCDLRIQHGSISRKHAVLYYTRSNNNNQETSLFLKDLGSKHGTTVNGRTMDSGSTIELYDDDTVMFGNVRESIFTVHWWKRKKESSPQHSVTKEADVNQQQPTSSSNESQKEKAAEGDEEVVPEMIVKDREIMEKASEGLSGREKRQAEIDAMTHSLDIVPTYQKFTAASEVQESSQLQSNEDDNDPFYPIIQKYELPVTNQLILPSESDKQRRTITCICMDSSGSRLAIGCTDSYLRMYDFGTMNGSNPQSNTSMIVEDGHWPIDCCYNPNSADQILIGTGSVQPVVLSSSIGSTSEYDNELKFVRGDRYVTDPSKTVGHIASVTAVQWHPLDRNIVVTSSQDGSARLWNISRGKKQFGMLTCDTVLVAKNSKRMKTAVTSLCIHPAGREVAIGTSCGSIQIWNISNKSHRADRVVFDAHGGSNKPIHCLVYDSYGIQLASRSAENESVRIWNNLQRLSPSSEPALICCNLNTEYEHSNCDFSPDGNLLIASATHDRHQQRGGSSGGFLNIYNVSSSNGDEDQLRSRRITPIISFPMQSEPIVVKWHAKINQIIIGCSDGQTVVLYDPDFSTKGALVPLAKTASGPKRKKVDALTELLQSRAPAGLAAIQGEIITPIYQYADQKKRKKGDECNNESEKKGTSTMPERPVSFQHKMGTGKTGGVATTFQQFVADQTSAKGTGKAIAAIAGKDPREALFKYSTKDDTNIQSSTNSKKILAEKTVEQEEEEAMHLFKKKQIHH